MTYRDAARKLEEIGIGMQQRRKRHGAPVGQYQLFWRVDGEPATLHYVTLKPGVTPEQIMQVAASIAGRVNIKHRSE
jgi:hypothetical protein